MRNNYRKIPKPPLLSYSQSENNVKNIHPIDVVQIKKPLNQQILTNKIFGFGAINTGGRGTAGKYTTLQ